MSRVLLTATAVLAAVTVHGADVPLTVQEAIYDNLPGVSRTSEPFCQGVPLADSDAVKEAGSLGLSGAVAGQFRVLGRWPSGNIKWVKVCGTLSGLAARSTATVSLTAGGGNFGGSDLAVDTGSAITVSTGTADFTIRKTRFNVIDSATVNGVPVVTSSDSAARGLVITGPDPTAPYPGNVTCGPCTTPYSSANDPNSTAVVEENGPVMTVVKATGNHMDAKGNPYMQYTARLYFYKGKSAVRVVVSLRNANYDTSTVPSRDASGKTFNTAYKGFQAYELRISPNLSGPLSYSIEANGVQSGMLSAAEDSVYIYQGASNWMMPMQDTFYCAPGTVCASMYTRDTGFVAKRNGSVIASGTATQYPKGWASISNAAGTGIEIGMYEFAGQWPASLEFNGGGTDVRIGLFSSRNSQPVYQPWPAYSTREAYLIFNSATPASYENDFRSMQHPLIARAPRTHYNATGVFAFPIADAAQEDQFYASLPSQASPSLSVGSFCFGGRATNCTPDRGAAIPSLIGQGMQIGLYRAYTWPLGGPMNQEEFRWSDMMRFLQRGDAGRWINSAQFYRFAIDRGMFPHADGRSTTDSTVNNFSWRDRPRANTANREVDSRGFPAMACLGGDANPNPCGTIANSDKAIVSWSFVDYLHNHYSGIFDYYFLTGDEAVRDAVVPLKDYYLNNNTYQGVTSPTVGTGWPTRAVGIHLIGASNFSAYLKSIGDSDADGVLLQAKGVFGKHVRNDTCVSGYPKGCTAPPVNSYPAFPDNEPAGVNRKRGIHTSNSFRGTYFCTSAANPGGIPAYYRAQSTFQSSILIEGLIALRRAAGPSWSDYQLALDLAYGVSQWGLSEAFSDNGEDRWFVGGGSYPSDSLFNGFRFGIQFDHSQECPSTSTVVQYTTTRVGDKIYNNISLADNVQGHWMHVYAHYLMNGQLTEAEQRKLRFGLYWVGARKSSWPADYGGYQLGAIIDALSQPAKETLQDVPFTVINSGDGSYRLSWTVPAGARRYRIKWSNLVIAPSTGLLNFDPLTHKFGMDPERYDTWFGANNVTEPAPAAVGTTQTFDITGTGAADLSEQNFSVKAYIAGDGADPGGPPAIIEQASGNGQSGTVGQLLASPLVVRVSDSRRKPVSGAKVTFAVSAGGGTVTAGSATTNSSGLASTTLRLGSAAGTNTVTAKSGTLAALTFTATATAAAGGTSKLSIVSGTGQTGGVGETLRQPFVVKVTDAAGKGVSGAAVVFAVTTGGGTITPSLVATDAAGIASATLRLGPAPGTNTVLASSAGLTNSPATFTAVASAADKPDADVSWSLQSVSGSLPAFVGGVNPIYDGLSGQVLLYAGPAGGAPGNYATDMWAYNPGANQFTHIRGTGSTARLCPADLPDMPGDRLPGGQMALDTKRKLIWLYGGTNAACNGAVVSVSGTKVTWVSGTDFHPSWANQKVTIGGVSYTIAAVTSTRELTLVASAGVQSSVVMALAAPNTNPRRDTYFLKLNAKPADNVWQQVQTTTVPSKAIAAAATVYDPDHDILFSYGYDGAAGTQNNFVFCRTTENPVPGTPTPVQTAAGCVKGDNWNLISPKGAVQPPATYFPSMVYDTTTKKVLLYGGGRPDGKTFYNQIWAYDVPSRTWTQKALTATAPPVYSGAMAPQPALAYNGKTGRILFHQTANTGAPADWEYDPSSDAWKKLTSSGGGPATESTVVYDPAGNRLIAVSKNPSTSRLEIWYGNLKEGAGPCDVNGDGVYSSADVQTSYDQILGTATCGSADVNRDGACNVVDVQKTINAVRGAGCS